MKQKNEDQLSRVYPLESLIFDVFILFVPKERVPAFYDRLYEALHLLVEFFSVNGKGLTGAKLHTDTYTKMELLYGLNKVLRTSLLFDDTLITFT